MRHALAWIAPSPSASVSTEATGNGPWPATASASDGPSTKPVTSRGSARPGQHPPRGGEDAAHPPRGDHLPREPGPETRTGRQLSPDQLHRHQPPPGDPPGPIPPLPSRPAAGTSRPAQDPRAAAPPLRDNPPRTCDHVRPQCIPDYQTNVSPAANAPRSDPRSAAEADIQPGETPRRGRRVAVSCCPAQ
jgi:hypothetical protein